MRKEVSVKTRTEVDKNGDFLISCFSDKNPDGTTTPVLFKSVILEGESEIDNVKGKEGELMLSYEGNTVGDINSDGEMILSLENDDANRYRKEEGDLLYER